MTKAKLHLIQSHQKRKLEKSFWLHLVLALMMTLIGQKALAQEIRPEVLKSHTFKNNKGGDVIVTIQRMENVMGTPYQVEVRGSCENVQFSDAKSAPVIHVENFCDVKLSSPELKENRLSFTIKEVDSKRFNKLSRKLDPESLIKLKPTCLDEAKQVSWEIDNFCN